MFNAFVKFYNFSSLSTCSMFSSTLQLLFLPNMSEDVEFDESIEHVEREEKL
jgi:hypothetical protein